VVGLSEVLVDARWLYERLGSPDIRIVEVDYDPSTAYNV
jgi:thiosulfate/3-mercaptopyruvate sulfurtransferase